MVINRAYISSLQYALLVAFISQITTVNAQSLARNKPVTMSSRWNNWDGSRAVDGNYATNADHCRCCAATLSEHNPWLQVDLGNTYLISRILVYGRTDISLYKTQNLTGLIIKTDDGLEFRPPSKSWYKYDTFFNFPLPKPVSTRYVKLTTSDSRVLTICELDVYNDRIISLGKPVEMVSQYNHWTGNRAVDGTNSTIPSSCQCCAATAYNPVSWLQVYLGSNFYINYVTIYGRTDGTWPGQTYEGMIIKFDGQEVETIPESTENRQTEKYFEFRSETTSAVNNVRLELFKNETGSTTQLVVCEIEIYGDCIDGYFEENCTACGHCRNDSACDKSSGKCLACEDGFLWTDMLCTEMCTKGTYGQDCISQCGFCRYGRTCQVSDGLCEACEDGFDERDLTCKTECPDGWFGTNCSETCRNCFNNTICSKSDGHCPSCALGYDFQDKTCNTECADGFYGNCTLPCGQCKSPGECNKKTGSCPSGCNLGFTGPNCMIVCPDGKFGENCIRCCGMCKDGDVCDKSTGDCPNGCIEGYQGKHCMSEVTGEEQFSVTIPVLVGSNFASMVVGAILAVFIVSLVRKIRKTRSSGNTSDIANRDSNYDSLNLSTLQTDDKPVYNEPKI